MTHKDMQIRILGNFGLNGFVPSVKDNEGTLSRICKEDIKTSDHFLLECPQFKEKFGFIS